MIIGPRHSLSRRRMLRGMLGSMAVAVGLPPLEAMLNTHGTAYAGGEALPRRFISFMFGNGVMPERFEPTTTGTGWELTPQLAPFSNIRDYVTLCTGLRNPTVAPAIGHHEGLSVFSGYDYAPSNAGGFASNWGGPTIDQIIADIIAARDPTVIHSLQVGITKFDSPVDNGTAAKALSAQGQPGRLTAKYPIHSPREVWSTLFGEFTQPDDLRPRRLSILDAVREEIHDLEPELGAHDRQRLEAHLTNVEELEAKIQALPPPCTIPGEPTHDNAEGNGAENLSLVNQLMAELIAYAFTCDITRVASNLFCGVAAESVFGETGAPNTHHIHSHANDEGYHVNIVFIMTCLARLLEALRDVPDVDGGTLLDSTLVFASSDVTLGYTHGWQRPPIIIGGHGRGHLAHPGIHYQALPPQFPNDAINGAGNTTDVLLTLAQAFDPAMDGLGGGVMRSTTPLTEIMA